MTKENGKVKNFNVKKFIIAMLIAAIVCVSVLAVLFGIDKTFPTYVAARDCVLAGSGFPYGVFI